MTNREKYNDVLKKILSLEDEENIETIERGTTSNWDSVGHVALVSELEAQFDIMLEIEDIIGFKTYDQGIEILGRYGVSFDE